jgi:ketosteroid isomerase-like protein
MSQENVEIVRRIYDAAGRRDDDATWLALYDPEVDWDVSHSPARDLLGRRVYHGHEGLRSFFRDWHEAWEEVTPELEEVIDAGEHAISVETTRGRGRTSGAEVELPHYAVWTIRNGKVVRVVWFATRDEALEAAGLRE